MLDAGGKALACDCNIIGEERDEGSGGFKWCGLWDLVLWETGGVDGGCVVDGWEVWPMLLGDNGDWLVRS